LYLTARAVVQPRRAGASPAIGRAVALSLVLFAITLRPMLLLLRFRGRAADP
jgi:hypothetical protein